MDDCQGRRCFGPKTIYDTYNVLVKRKINAIFPFLNRVRKRTIVKNVIYTNDSGKLSSHVRRTWTFHRYVDYTHRNSS